MPAFKVLEKVITEGDRPSLELFEQKKRLLRIFYEKGAKDSIAFDEVNELDRDLLMDYDESLRAVVYRRRSSFDRTFGNISVYEEISHFEKRLGELQSKYIKERMRSSNRTAPLPQISSPAQQTVSEPPSVVHHLPAFNGIEIYVPGGGRYPYSRFSLIQRLSSVASWDLGANNDSIPKHRDWNNLAAEAGKVSADMIAVGTGKGLRNFYYFLGIKDEALKRELTNYTVSFLSNNKISPSLQPINIPPKK